MTIASLPNGYRAVVFGASGGVGTALAGWFKSDLTVPDQVAKALALYLMLCIGFKGGVEARAAGLSMQMLSAGGLGLVLSFLAPFAAYGILKLASKLDRATAAATAAHYGSVSVVTFAAGRARRAIAAHACHSAHCEGSSLRLSELAVLHL